jgi:hypothetical protein
MEHGKETEALEALAALAAAAINRRCLFCGTLITDRRRFTCSDFCRDIVARERRRRHDRKRNPEYRDRKQARKAARIKERCQADPAFHEQKRAKARRRYYEPARRAAVLEAARQWREANPEHYKQLQRDWRARQCRTPEGIARALAWQQKCERWREQRETREARQEQQRARQEQLCRDNHQNYKLREAVRSALRSRIRTEKDREYDRQRRKRETDLIKTLRDMGWLHPNKLEWALPSEPSLIEPSPITPPAPPVEPKQPPAYVIARQKRPPACVVAEQRRQQKTRDSYRKRIELQQVVNQAWPALPGQIVYVDSTGIATVRIVSPIEYRCGQKALFYARNWAKPKRVRRGYKLALEDHERTEAIERLGNGDKPIDVAKHFHVSTSTIWNLTHQPRKRWHKPKLIYLRRGRPNNTPRAHDGSDVEVYRAAQAAYRKTPNYKNARRRRGLQRRAIIKAVEEIVVFTS